MVDLNIDFELSKVVKSGDYEYARIVWKNTYCESDPKLAIFIIEEFFILKMKDEIFLINIKIPSITPNPNNAVYSDIVNFLMNTRFIK
jgi:hypothetical protein